MKKGGKKINLTLVFSARALYSAIAILMLAIVGGESGLITQLIQAFLGIAQKRLKEQSLPEQLCFLI